MNNFERMGSAQPESLDTDWYERFDKIGSFQSYEYLDGDKQYREEQRQAFINGDIINPTLDYPEIDVDNVARDEAALLQLKEDIIAQETNETVRQVYRWKLNEKIAELRMLKATSTGDSKRFKRYSEFIYGKPSSEVFAVIIKSLKEDIIEKSSSSNPDIQKAAKELSDLLPNDIATGEEYALPQEDDIAKVRTQTLEELGGLLDMNAAEDKEYTAEEIRNIFQDTLDSLRAEGWSVVVDTSSKSGISVDQEQKVINIPESRKLSLHKLKSLIAHEVGTHVVRRLNGERSKLKLLGLGLDRYEKGEEGIATMKEQVLGDKIKDFTGLEGSLAISLAIGVDGTPRDFREVYTIIEKYFYLKALSAGKNLEEALKSAQTNAWKRTVRTFRGTDCQTRGSCLTKDIIYREGNIGVWNVIRDNPDELMRFSVGKYDPANMRHIWILNQLGISEADLDELEK